MLKIRDDVDLKELEKFGFKPKYNEDTGEINALEKRIKGQEYLGLGITKEYIKSKIRIFKRFQKERIEWRINELTDYFDIETLYDLIQAGLVEKVEEK